MWRPYSPQFVDSVTGNPSCDDKPIIADQIERYIRTAAVELEVECSVELYYSRMRLCTLIEANEQHDILFLDIKMDGLVGFAVGKMLKKQINRPLIIYFSSYREQIEEIVEIQPFRFLRKPLDYSKFKDYLSGAFDVIFARKNQTCFEYRSNGPLFTKA